MGCPMSTCIKDAGNLPRLIYHRRALSNELLLRAVTGTSFFTIRLCLRRVLVVVKPETLVGWHRKALQLLWRWKSPGGRPGVLGNLRALIVEMLRENPIWRQRRVASELAQ